MTKIRVVKPRNLFKPIAFEIEVETRDELLELYHRLTIGFSKIVKVSESGKPFPHSFTGMSKDVCFLLSDLLDNTT